MMGGVPPYLPPDSQVAPAPSSREVRLEAGGAGDEARAQEEAGPAIPAPWGPSRYSREACAEDVTGETKLDSGPCSASRPGSQRVKTPFHSEATSVVLFLILST